MQDGTTADMLSDVPALIEFIIERHHARPWDVIITGTPSGVGVFRDPPVFLEPGDLVRCRSIGSARWKIGSWTRHGERLTRQPRSEAATCWPS